MTSRGVVKPAAMPPAIEPKRAACHVEGDWEYDFLYMDYTWMHEWQ